MIPNDESQSDWKAEEDNAPHMVPAGSAEEAKSVKPQPLMSRRLAAALIDAGIVGFVGALVPTVLAFIMVRLELNSFDPFNHAAIFLYLGSVVLLSFNWICPLLMIVIGGSWASWIVAKGLALNCVFPIALLLIAPLYETLCVCSSHQATPGKRLVGLIVQTGRGAKLTAKQALLRHCARAVSAASILGYCIAFLNGQNRCLHDLICKTEVVDASSYDAAGSLKTSKQNMLVFIVVSLAIGTILGLLFLMFAMGWREILKH
ncbi:MAG TPA: RDD family protein [Trichormus sp.]|jgi:uncharacterized RDD family membrane protein YckC